MATKSSVWLEPCTYSHIERMRHNIHNGNEREIWCAKGISGYEGLLESYGSSDEVMAIMYNDEVAAIMGIKIGSLLSGRAFPWLICSNLIMDHRLTFLRHFREIIRSLQKRFRVLESLIFSENTEVLKMLEWVGFSHYETKHINDYPFYRMVWFRGGDA